MPLFVDGLVIVLIVVLVLGSLWIKYPSLRNVFPSKAKGKGVSSDAPEVSRAGSHDQARTGEDRSASSE